MLVLVVSACLSPGCRSEGASEAGSAKAPETVPLVEAVPAREGELPLVEQVTGMLRARNQVEIHPELEARIVEVFVRDGEAVSRGQPLVRLEPVSVTSQLRGAQADVELAMAGASAARARVAELEAQVVRTRQLAGEELVSPLELETQEAQYAAAKAAAGQAEAAISQARATVAERRNSVEKSVVRSPIDGRVGRRNAEVGMLADPATVLFVVGDIDELIVEVPLNEKMLAHVEQGQTVHVRSSVLGGEPLIASLSRISPFLTPGSFSTSAEIDLEHSEGKLRPGMFVDVDILYGKSRRATLVPLSALWEDPASGRWVVYVVGTPVGHSVATKAGSGAVEAGPNEIAPVETRPVEARPVEVVAHGKDTAGVSGVQSDEWVVTVGQFLLDENDARRARVRATTWEGVLELQGRQQEDLLRDFLDKQQQLARTRGVQPPTTDEAIEEAQAQDTVGVAGQ